MKCDEEKPSCLRCLSTGRKCDGYDLADSTSPTYDKGLTWKNFPSSPDSDRLSSQLTTLTRTPSITVERSEKEARSFHFFCQRTAPPLAGFFGDYLWNSSILQAAHHEPAIYHAVIALGSLHERFMAHGGLVARSKTTVYRDDFALQEYSTAIRALVQPLIEKRSQSMDVCLIACILFSCFEVILSGPPRLSFLIGCALTLHRACRAVTGHPLPISIVAVKFCSRCSVILSQCSINIKFSRLPKCLTCQ